MSIKFKVLIILLTMGAVYLAVDIAFQRLVILPGFLELEQEEAQKDADRVVQAIKREIRYIDTLCHDWAAWDDTHEFIVDLSREYIENNLLDATFVDNRINLFYYIDTEGKVAWGKILDLKSTEPMSVAQFPEKRFEPDHPLLDFDVSGQDLANVSVSGIFSTNAGPMLLASRPIITGDNQGPIRGALIMGRYFTEETVESIKEQTRVDFSARWTQEALKDARKVEGLDKGRTEGFKVVEKTDEKLVIRAVMEDIMDRPALILDADIPRKISEKGYAILRYAAISTVLTGLIFLGTVLFFLDSVVLAPLTRLKKAALSISESREPTAMVKLKRKDEIGQLGSAFDQMVERLSATLENLRHSEEMYRVITEYSLAHITLVQNGKIIYANQQTWEKSEYTQSELIGKPILELVHPEDRQMANQRTLALLKKGGGSDHYEARYITQSGKVRWLEILSVPIRYKGKKTILGHSIDITQRKQAQREQKRLAAQLQRAQKMEAIGTLAGGVAHDLNNILSGIASYPDLLLMNLPEDSPLRRPLVTIRRTGQKAGAIVQDLLTLARRGVVIKKLENLNEIVEDYLQSPEFEQLKFSNASFSLDLFLDPELPWINGSHVHLSKTLMNLVNNAVEAMPEGGNLKIVTQIAHLKNPMEGFETIASGNYAVLKVMDTGIGFSLDDVEKIFEPFYTKKVMGISGTGLGMAVVWATVKDHSGFIDVESKIGEGSTFSLFFPSTDLKPEPKTSSPIRWEDVRGRGEKILLVDDSGEQREIATEMLEAIGYTVTAVSAGEAAVQYLKKNHADLILLDMIMDPGIDGLETYKQVLRFRPNQKAIIVSGYSETERIRQAKKLGAGDYVKKPYGLDTIAQAIKKELER